MIPEYSDDALYQLLSSENVEEFNRKRRQLDTSNLAGKHYRGLDLRGMDAEGLDFSGSYFRGADLRGLDLRGANLEGCSLAEARISGCYFSADLSAEEIRLSVEKGTRLRRR